MFTIFFLLNICTTNATLILCSKSLPLRLPSLAWLYRHQDTTAYCILATVHYPSPQPHFSPTPLPLKGKLPLFMSGGVWFALRPPFLFLFILVFDISGFCLWLFYLVAGLKARFPAFPFSLYLFFMPSRALTPLENESPLLLSKGI